MNIANIFLASAVALLCSCSSNKSAENAQAEAVEETVTTEVTEPEASPVTELAAGSATIPASELTTVIDFNADWCGPCQQFKPVFEAAAEKYAGQLNFISVNVDSCPEVAAKYKVSSIPQITFVAPDGTILASEVGSRDTADFEKLIDSVIKK